MLGKVPAPGQQQPGERGWTVPTAQKMNALAEEGKERARRLHPRARKKMRVFTEVRGGPGRDKRRRWSPSRVPAPVQEEISPTMERPERVGGGRLNEVIQQLAELRKP